MKLYGEEKNDTEIINFVNDYYNKISKDKYHRFAKIMSLIPQNQNKYILDYGCGWGVFSIPIRDKGNKVLAIDIEKNETDICKLVWGEQTNLEFSNSSIESLPDNTFDYVLSSEVIEHVHNPGNYLSEINRVLKPGGNLIISIPNVMNPVYFLSALFRNDKKLKKESEKILKDYDKAHIHINSWDAYHFVHLLSSVGFRLEKYLPEGKVPFPVPFKNRIYIKTGLKKIGNLSFRIVYLFKKEKNIKINRFD